METTTGRADEFIEDVVAMVSIPSIVYNVFTTEEAIAHVFTYYESPSLFPPQIIVSAIATPIIGAIVGGRAFINLSEPIVIHFQFLLPVSNSFNFNYIIISTV